MVDQTLPTILAHRREAPHCTVGQCRDDRRLIKGFDAPKINQQLFARD